MKKLILNFFSAPILLVVLSACQTEQKELIISTKSPVELRAMQSRIFETDDKNKVLRAVIATFQDLGYTIQKVEASSGSVSADKLAILRMTATTYPRGDTKTVVRSNAIVKLGTNLKQGYQVDSAEFYQQNFFEPLSKELFLTALEIEDEPDDAKEADGAKKQTNDDSAKAGTQ